MRILFLIALLLPAGGLVWAGPVSLSLVGTSVPPATGDPVTLDLIISGLGSGGPPNVGSFDIFVQFDASILAPSGVTFGNFLGDPGLFEALTDFQIPHGDTIEVAEVSLLAGSALAALQPTAFTLATVTFSRTAPGLAGFTYRGGPIDDQDGVLIFGTKTEVPEPGNGLLPLAALGLMVLRQFRHRLPAGVRLRRVPKNG